MIDNQEQGFQLLFAANPRPMWVFDTETLAFIEVNEAAEAQYGYSREEFLQMRITDIRPPEDVERLLQVLQAERPALHTVGEWRHRLKDGRIIDVEVASQSVTFDERPARLVVAQDVSERKSTRHALASQTSQFALVAELGLKALSGIEIDELLTLAVERVASELSVDFTKVLELQEGGKQLRLRAGVGWKEGYRPGETLLDARDDSQAAYALRSHGRVVVDDLRNETRFSGRPLLTAHGVISGISVVIPGGTQPYGVFSVHTAHRRKFVEHEIDFVQTVANVLATAIERSHSDRLVRASEERFRAVVQNALHMVTLVDPQGTILYDSPPVRRILGYEPEERIGQNMMGYVHPDDFQAVASKMGELTTAGAGLASVQVRVRHRDGSWRIVEANGTNMMNHDALQGIVVNWHDVTERVLAQQELESLNAELEARVRQRTAQLEATNRELEAFAYSVSHDLRAPLRAMDGFARILMEDADELAPTTRRYLQRIRHNARQMDLLINDLLSFSRLNRQALEKQTVNPRDVVQEALETLELESEGRHIDLTLHPMPPALADRSLLRVVYVNLLSNALKYTRRRETARVEVGATSRPDSTNGSAVYYVRDNGVGFDMKYAPKLFGVFQRLHRVEEYEGTGVGLATVQRIVRRHGGAVWVESAVDQGTTVYFTLEEA